MIFIDLDAKDELTPQNMRQLVACARRVLPRAITRSSRPRRDGELCRTTLPIYSSGRKPVYII